jgi:hypothetical protein
MPHQLLNTTFTCLTTSNRIGETRQGPGADTEFKASRDLQSFLLTAQDQFDMSRKQEMALVDYPLGHLITARIKCSR